MNKISAVTILSLIMALLLGVCSCTINPAITVTMTETATTATKLVTQPASTVTKTIEIMPTNIQPTATPEYHILSFTIQGREEYSFPIYIYENQTLHFLMKVESPPPTDIVGPYSPLRLYILTPSGNSLCSYGIDVPGEYANGTLSEYFCQSFLEYATHFSPSDYNWGEGYYRMTVKNDYPDILATVRVEYWIGG